MTKWPLIHQGPPFPPHSTVPSTWSQPCSGQGHISTNTSLWFYVLLGAPSVSHWVHASRASSLPISCRFCLLLSPHSLHPQNIHMNINSAFPVANHLDTCFAKWGFGHISQSHMTSQTGTCRGQNWTKRDESLMAAFQALRAGQWKELFKVAPWFALSPNTEAKTYTLRDTASESSSCFS